MNGWVYSGAPNTWGQQVAGVEVQKYLAGEADWDEVTKTCIEQWSELRKQQNNLNFRDRASIPEIQIRVKSFVWKGRIEEV